MFRQMTSWFATLVLAGFACAQPPTVEVLPTQVRLLGAEAQQRATVLWEQNAQLGALVDAGRVRWESTNPAVAVHDQGYIRPRGNGRCTLVAVVTNEAGEEVARSESWVEVVDFDRPHAWNFRHDVQAVLARQNCNSGACHGALAGKGGFRLSLRGYDPQSDWFTITREAQGRRVELADPGQSLLLTKPTGLVAHKGGLRLDPASRDYRVVAEWIASGAPGPSADEAQLEKISVLPEQSRLALGESQQILVQAHFSDGRVQDVTSWAKFTASDEAVAAVDEHGQVTVRGPGEGAVVAWFGSKIALSRVTVPFTFTVADDEYAAAPQRNFIDALVLEKLQQLNLEPGKRCEDHDFIRRAMIDTIGRLPTREESQAFLADTAADKRDRLIESLLERPEFVDYWTYKWSDLLLINGTKLRPAGVKAFYTWIRQQVEQNVPWDQFVRRILTAQGVTNENGATNFYAIHQDPENLTENASQAFLGLAIACAKCHNHPLEKWTNDQYYAMANMFARVRGKGWGGDSRNGDGIRTVYVSLTGDLIQPKKGKPQPPAPLDGQPLEFDDPSDRRAALADWMADPTNPYFARAITNRVWANFFSVGLVEQVDDLRLSNPASNEPLLQAAADYLIAHQFDLKQLMRAILQSETYQRTSLPTERNAPDGRFYSHYYPRRMMAEVLLDSIDQVLETQSKFDFVAFQGSDRQKTDFYPEGTRAIQLYDAAVESYFLKTFGRNSREITCECERSDEPSMVQVLHLANGETLNPKLQASGKITQWIEQKRSPREIVEELFVTAMGRLPRDDERETLLKTIDEYPSEEQRQALEDLCWSVLTSNEFIFNH